MKVAIILTVAAGDTKQGLKTISDSVDALLQGVNPSPFDPTAFEYYRINPTLLPAGTEELIATVWLGIDPVNVSRNVIVELTRQNPAYRQVSFDAGGATREFMVAQLESFALQDGAARRLVTQAGATLVTTPPQTFLNSFVPYDVAPPPPILKLL